MHTIKLTIEDEIYQNIMFLLSNLKVKGLTIDVEKEDDILKDWSYLEEEIDKGLNSGISNKSHEEIVSDIKQKYA
jgi:hypothetical protein